MLDLCNDNPTREKIILALKKNGTMSVEDLSAEVSITPMGVRQHLLILERNGLVQYNTRRHGVGRPGFLYRLTERADDLFPKAYQELALDILSDIEKLDGSDKLSDIFRRRKKKMLDEMSRLLTGKRELSERVRAIADIMERDGYMVELNEEAESYTLRFFNCPVYRVALLYKEACNQDLRLLSDLTTPGITRRKCLTEGAQACEYVIPKTLKSA